MASDYTTNYNLDKYVATDKPNLRDQYNAAMDKIDSALLAANNTANQAYARVGDFDEDISDLNTAVAAVDSRVTTVNSSLTTLKNKLPDSDFTATNTVKKAIDAVSSRVTIVEHPYFGVIGDSFSDGSADWPSIAATKLNWGLVNAAKGGSAFSPTSDANQVPFINQIDTLTANANWSKIRHVIVYGVVNDFTDTGHTAGQTATYIDAFIAKWESISNRPKLTFVLGNAGAPRRSFGSKGYAGYPKYVNTLCNYIRRIHGYPVVPAYAWLLGYVFSNVFGSDNLHPNSAGSHIIASKMCQILTGSYSSHVGTFHIIPSSNTNVGPVESILDIYDTNATLTFNAHAATDYTQEVGYYAANATTVASRDPFKLFFAKDEAAWSEEHQLSAVTATAPKSISISFTNNALHLVRTFWNPITGSFGIQVSSSATEISTSFNWGPTPPITVPIV